jgi:aminoglycoside phosphotransferase (APT) family kinase protein
LPRPLATARLGNLTAGLQSYVAGRSLQSSLGDWRATERAQIRDLSLAAAWLTEFHNQAQAGRAQWDRSLVERWIEEPLAAYREVFGPNTLEEALFARVRSSADLNDVTPVRLVWQHNDFSPWNLFRGGTELKVIDWEGARVGLPLCDLLFFISQWSAASRRQRGRQALLGFRELFLDGPVTPFSLAAERAVRL